MECNQIASDISSAKETLRCHIVMPRLSFFRILERTPGLELTIKVCLLESKAAFNVAPDFQRASVGRWQCPWPDIQEVLTLPVASRQPPYWWV